MPADETISHKKTFFQRISHFLIIAAYLWLLMCVFTLHNAILLSDWNILAHLGNITFKALLFGKFVLIAEHLHLGKRAEHYALIWPITIKAALFAITIIGFDLLEEMLVEAFRGAPAATSGDIFALTSLPQIVALTFMAFIALRPFFAINELGRVLGKDHLRELFFKPQTE
ncbi:MAG: hypothetical protein V4441_06800 [Pseudomonadota bacterium]